MYAIYARQSVDRIDSISIESQIEYCQHEIHEKEYKVYQDKGYSGKNTNRPEFQVLMNDIKNNKVEKVIVYKLDRISRSILDFANMMDIFSKHNVEFISCTEKFDTSTPMGRAMLNICIVFAALERETIQMRVADAYASRSTKGFYMGGRIPYGFDKEMTIIDGIKTSKYVAKEEEIEQIKMIYSLYEKQSTSVGDIVRYLSEHNIKKSKGSWNSARIMDTLKNPIYVKADIDIFNFYNIRGTEIINNPEDFIGSNGCYLYSKRESNSNRKDMADYGDMKLVLAPHEGIIDSYTWLVCRIKADNNKQIPNGKRAMHTWLSGKLKCRRCGYALRFTRWYGKTKTNDYYVCSNHQNIKTCEGIGTVRQSVIEHIVFEKMCKHFSEFKVQNQNIDREASYQEQTIKQMIAQKEAEIKNILSKLSSANDTLIKYINAEIERLDKELNELKNKYIEIEFQKERSKMPNINVDELGAYLKHWDEISFDDKRKIADLFIQKVYVNKVDGKVTVEPIFLF